METDDGVRGANGVVLSLLEIAGGKVRIVMDDVSNDSGSSVRGPWKHEVVVTWKDYDATDIEEQKLSEEELAGLGAYVIARLAALKEHPHR